MQSWTAVTVGVESMDRALALWVGEFGFAVKAEREGPDADLARLWGLAAGDIRRQTLVRTGAADTGMLHLVEFVHPEAPVREGADVFDLCPKNLDIYVRDMRERMDVLAASGYRFRNDDFTEVTAPNGITFREVHMPAHDRINVVLLELVGETLPFTARGFAGVGPLIAIVPDADRERAFYRDVIGLDLLSHNILEGPDIERMIGLPEGAALDVSIWGTAAEPLGQVEVIEYRGVRGRDLYPRARPKATGILHLAYLSEDLDSTQARLRDEDLRLVEHGYVETLYSSGRVLSLSSPAGFRIEYHEAR